MSSKRNSEIVRGRFDLFVNHEEKTYFVRMKRFGLDGKIARITDIHPQQIKDIMKTMIEFEEKGFRPVDSTIA